MQYEKKKPVDDLEALEIALVSKCGPFFLSSSVCFYQYQLVVKLFRGLLVKCTFVNHIMRNIIRFYAK
jgi:hypothetical protein